MTTLHENDHTWCSECGYCLDALPDTSRVCPECGGERGRVEIIIAPTLLKRKRGIWLAKAIVASALIALAFFFLVAPWRVFRGASLHLHFPVALRDNPYGRGSYSEWAIFDQYATYSMGVGGPSWDRSAQIDIALRLNSGSYVHLIVNPSMRTYSIPRGNTVHGPLDLAVLRAFAASHGVNTDRASFDDECRFVLSCIDAIISGRPYDPNSGPFEVGWIHRPGPVILPSPCWSGFLSTALVFILISILLCRRGWRRLTDRYRLARSVS